jgi:hypothetical protein
MKKTFADECLELAEKATPGEWRIDQTYSDSRPDAVTLSPGYWFSPGNYSKAMDERCNDQTQRNAQFIAAARTMVPELARRLKLACDELRSAVPNELIRNQPALIEFIDSLEAPMEKKK